MKVNEIMGMCTNFPVSFNLFSMTSRYRCMANMLKVHIPSKTVAKDGRPIPKAAVMIPICLVDKTPSLLYTRRSSNLRSYAGQISFPGGKLDEHESPTNAALRETYEEIGLNPEKIEIWGCGNPIPGRNYNISITPVVGSINNLQNEDFNVNDSEVKEVFAVPIETLCNPKNHFHTQFKNGIVLPVFVADEYKIWGVTAFLTHTFLSCLLPTENYYNDWKSKRIRVQLHD